MKSSYVIPEWAYDAMLERFGDQITEQELIEVVPSSEKDMCVIHVLDLPSKADTYHIHLQIMVTGCLIGFEIAGRGC